MKIWDESYELLKPYEDPTKSPEDVWGILSDIEEVVEDWSWLTDSGKLVT